MIMLLLLLLLEYKINILGYCDKEKGCLVAKKARNLMQTRCNRPTGEQKQQQQKCSQPTQTKTSR